MKVLECPMGRFHPHGARYFMNTWDGRCAYCSDEANAPRGRGLPQSENGSGGGKTGRGRT